MQVIDYLRRSEKDMMFEASALELVNNVNGKFLTMELPPHMKK